MHLAFTRRGEFGAVENPVAAGLRTVSMLGGSEGQHTTSFDDERGSVAAAIRMLAALARNDFDTVWWSWSADLRVATAQTWASRRVGDDAASEAALVVDCVIVAGSLRPSQRTPLHERVWAAFAQAQLSALADLMFDGWVAMLHDGRLGAAEGSRIIDTEREIVVIGETPGEPTWYPRDKPLEIGMPLTLEHTSKGWQIADIGPTGRH